MWQLSIITKDNVQGWADFPARDQVVEQMDRECWTMGEVLTLVYRSASKL